MLFSFFLHNLHVRGVLQVKFTLACYFTVLMLCSTVPTYNQLFLSVGSKEKKMNVHTLAERTRIISWCCDGVVFCQYSHSQMLLHCYPYNHIHTAHCALRTELISGFAILRVHAPQASKTTRYSGGVKKIKIKHSMHSTHPPTSPSPVGGKIV